MAESNLRSLLATSSSGGNAPKHDAPVGDAEMAAILGVLRGDEDARKKKRSDDETGGAAGRRRGVAERCGAAATGCWLSLIRGRQAAERPRRQPPPAVGPRRGSGLRSRAPFRASRCPVVASGRAKELGIEDRCRGEDLQLEEVGDQHFAACHLIELNQQP